MSLDLREAVARMMCRKAREWQGFPEKFLADEVENAWPLFLSDADGILALPQLSDLTVRIGDLEGALEPFAEAARLGATAGQPPFMFVSADAYDFARQALAAKAGGDMASREPSTDTCAAPASGLAGQDRGGAEP
jgi:hypothetical protein